MTMTLERLHHPVLSKDEANQVLPELQLKLMKLQLALYQTAQRAIIVVEGTDASGKGGAIQRMTKNMDPRGVRVHPIGPPSQSELASHYLQRFWQRLPHNGQLVIFDRSWYGRVLVERVEKGLSKSDWLRAYEEINQFEKTLVADGTILLKLFLHIDKDEQKKRFQSRFENPEKRWKLTKADLLTRTYWTQYQEAFEDMFEHTSLENSPWHVIAANNKKYARVECLKLAIRALEAHIDQNELNLTNQEVETLARKELNL